MKKSPYFFIALAFIAAFMYLNQKINIYVQAYKLSKSYRTYNDLSDKRDYLMASLAPQISVSKVNQWAATNNFSPVEKERIVALNLRAPQMRAAARGGVLNRVIPAVQARTVSE